MVGGPQGGGLCVVHPDLAQALALLQAVCAHVCPVSLSLMCDSLCHVLYVSRVYVCKRQRKVLEALPVLTRMPTHRGPQTARIQAFHLMLTGPSPGF